jgi:anti-sigma-K factor RskA
VEVVKTVEAPAKAPGRLVAVLQKDAAAPAFLLTVDPESRTFTMRRVAVEPEPGKSYELWLVSEKFSAPRSLGVVGGEEFTQRAGLAAYDAETINAATYAVSQEPEGGSPTGAPTGPVLFLGKLIEAVPRSP